jgi:uncharacterized protein with HEPN domain
MSRDALRHLDYLDHILEAIQRIEHYTDDCAPGFAAQHAEVPWNEMYTMRNRVAYGYFKVDLEIVWKTIETDLPELAQKIQQIRQPL